MRTWTKTLAALLVSSTAAFAQTPPAAAPLDPTHNQLDHHLMRWESEMKSVTALVGVCGRTEKSKAFGSIKEYEGSAKFLKPNMAILEMRNRKKPELFEKYISTGTLLYEFAAVNKVIRVHEIQANQGGTDDTFLTFLLGMKAEQAKKRYDLKLTKEDQYYIYVQVVPKLPADKADFQRAQIVLLRTTYLPRRLWFEQPNGDEVTWELPDLKKNLPLDRADFVAPLVPQGWTMERVPNAVVTPNNPQVPPRLARPNR